MVQISITTSGFPAVRTLLSGIAAGARAATGPIISLTSPLPYARYIEEGRSSRAVRRAGPALMFARGIEIMRPKIGPAIIAAIPRGAPAVQAAKATLNAQAVEEVRKLTPVRTGALRASVRESARPG